VLPALLIHARSTGAPGTLSRRFLRALPASAAWCATRRSGWWIVCLAC